jgi:microcystin degradation protein MlrC
LRIPPFSLKQLTTFHIKPETFDVIIAKGVNAPIAAYETVCNTIIQVNTPGVTAADMTVFKYKNRPVPLFPFES